MSQYIPAKGDFIAVTFNPQSGHEQKGRRPAIVISNKVFNSSTGLCIVCPITKTKRPFPFHVEIPEKSSFTGYIMVEQLKSIDFYSRKIKLIEKAPKNIIDEVLAILDACIYQNA